MLNKSTRVHPKLRYLVQEAALFLVWSYLALLGGTFNGQFNMILRSANGFLIGGGGLIWLLWRLHKHRLFPATSLDAPMIAFLAAVGLAIWQSSHLRLSLEVAMWILISVLWFYFWVDMLRAGLSFNLLSKILLLISSLVALFGVFQLGKWLLDWHRILGAGWLPLSTIRVTSLVGSPNSLVDYFILVLPLGLTWAARVRSGKRFLLLGWIGTILTLQIFTSSRGGWLGTAAAVGCWSLLWMQIHKKEIPEYLRKIDKHKWKAAFVGILLLLIMVFAAGLILWISKDPTHPSGWRDPIHSRDYIWTVALKMWKSHFWVGNGPGTFGFSFLKEYSIPDDMLLTHAHNFYLNILAETGVLGGLSVLWILWNVFKRAWQTWRFRQRLSVPVIGVLPALFGMAVHGFFEVSVVVIPFIALLVMTLLAMLFAEEHVPSFEGKRFLLSGWLWLIFALLVGFSAWNTPRIKLYMDGLEQASIGNWVNASQKMDEVVHADPSFALYWQQAAFAHGMLALNPDGSLQEAAQAGKALLFYRQALSLDPNYAIPWANQAVILWALGERELAVASMQTAVERAPRQARFWVTLGNWYEVMGRTKEAIAAYQQALKEQQTWKNTQFFHGTQLRSSSVEQLGIPTGILNAGWEALNSGQDEKAKTIFDQAIGLNQGEAYLGLAESYARQKEWAQAQRMLAIAKRIGLNGWLSVRVKLAQGDAAYGQSEYERAALQYEEAYSQVVHYTSFEWDAGSQDYALYIFHRQILQTDLLPGLTPIYSEEFLEAMERLAESYRHSGDHFSAMQMKYWVLQQRCSQDRKSCLIMP